MDNPSHIMAIDDDPFMLELIEAYLTDGGYHVSKAENGSVGLQHLKAQPGQFKAVLLDWEMPELNGLEVLKAIKADSQLSHLPVIMQTSRNSDEDMQAGMQAGAFFYLTKPFDYEKLLATLESALRQYSQLEEIKSNLREQHQSLHLLSEGQFHFRSPAEAASLTRLLSGQTTDPSRFGLGLNELFINAIEHGNLGIGYQQKTDLLESGQWEEEIQQRLQQDEYRDRFVSVAFRRLQDGIELTIQDQGKGFDWQAHTEFDPKKLLDPHGRGIAMAKNYCFEELTYLGNGNTVRVKIICTAEE